ncbi:VWA domain-containing protein [bacterium]|nr:VWA domain-containing protein [bacterium]
MRRLPIYLLLDVSDGMAGEPIEALEKGVQMLVSALRDEPTAMETAYLSVITFGDTAQQVVPLTGVVEFELPPLNTSGARVLGSALELLCNKIDTEVTKPTPEQKGDWEPLVFILTNGQPTDDWQKGAEEIKKRSMQILACAAGLDTADIINVLQQITENVVELKSASKDDFAAFFKWETQRIEIEREATL